MDNFEYSIQLNDRDWAEFFLVSEECNLAPATLATAEEQCLSDIEQGDGVPGRDCHASTNGQITARVGGRPGPGTGSSAPRGVPGDASLRWPAGGHLALPELLSGSEDEADLGSVGRFLCESDKPGCPSFAPMPSVQGRQPPCPPAAALTGPAEGSARKSPSSASRSEPGLRGPPRDHPPSPALETAPKMPVSPAREEASGERAGAEPSSPAGSPDVVRPKVPGQPRKSRKQRGASAVEAAQGDREPAGAAAQGTGVPAKAPLSSPLSSRKSKGKEKAAKPALVKLGSEEAGESKRPAPSPSTEEGDPALSATPKQKAKEPGAQPLGKAKATKHSKPGQAGGLGVRDNVPVISASGAAAPPGEVCQEVPEKPLHPKSVVAFGGDAAELQNEDLDSSPVKDSVVISVPEVYEHFFPDGPGNRAGWRGIFSIAPTSEVKKAVGALKSLLQRPMHLVRGQAPAPQALLRRGSGEKLSLVPLGRGEARPESLDMALALTGGPEVPLALTHKDMCLVFCAFASWAVKTSDLQAPDAWKTMFLASFGTLSAIRYFRRQVREGHPRT
ncbi:PREDICTED: PGC-1 and ERR-induced regulator in muscle protein 1-like [Charadrius vociferus]|uniref:PGC-1 and ERR-induced regulator in muscle protein 1-like n=1 Tax=Charadrius vociferus TaxID=50402 RepID=UPI000521A7C8|nr:PREDICTED: PGC-1 and ERR-induced regulator in muscle protein 1-like [Charadrius vociferus]